MNDQKKKQAIAGMRLVEMGTHLQRLALENNLPGFEERDLLLAQLQKIHDGLEELWGWTPD